MASELVISFLFPPSDYPSGIMVSKRIADNNQTVDVLQTKSKNQLQEFNNHIDKYIENRIILDLPCSEDKPDCIFKFIEKGLNSIKNDYDRIYSRSWHMANHFLAFEYKLLHPNAVWRAEFSDPLFLTMKNNFKSSPQMIIKDENYINRLNSKIDEFNQENHSNLAHIRTPASAYFIAEYITYLFADEIIFTNANQREIMLNRFPVNIMDTVLNKSLIKPHPSLSHDFYQIKDVGLDLNKDNVNIAYFGNEYYGLRHFEGLFYALGSLNHKYLEKIKVYIFINNDSLLKTLTKEFDNVIIRKPLKYLDFMNATTKFDLLLVNDSNTRGYFKTNPYLPSKLSDYLGSGSDIWSIYEKGSALSDIDVRYKSDMNDYPDIRNTLIQILEEHGYSDPDYTFNDDYLARRFTTLNELLEKENIRKNKYKNKLKKSENENREETCPEDGKLAKIFKKLK